MSQELREEIANDLDEVAEQTASGLAKIGVDDYTLNVVDKVFTTAICVARYGPVEAGRLLAEGYQR